MINFIRLGDATDHGGRVITASDTADYDGIPLARKGDLIDCPQHPGVQPNVIEEGDEYMLDEGRPLARAGYRGTCGCHLISSL
ncbi:PAAR repeat-containing protein [Burkholderia lata]|uniref:PAAR domain-containing protein n=1 Tax=Burkholderia lata (strain ATCC 17760 / DSM 23089 / LMG 22485 / NCIMB 9086 / R18194 / 383) TaxID=482957 RepID=UPI001452D16E|nr:PAAR domain-containing protein [Burkholderia lata]VWB35910.1 PAAR repeat-containing protein [Burkholderia lata]VWC59304.1 PAAR repeat-containing protein [Burkholderia lata]